MQFQLRQVLLTHKTTTDVKLDSVIQRIDVVVLLLICYTNITPSFPSFLHKIKVQNELNRNFPIQFSAS